jgi:HPt (histidine-containing phosphotransfer) domain-containing protein
MTIRQFKPLLNYQTLRALREELGEDFNDGIQEFKKEMDLALDEIQTEPTLERMYEIAHALKSISLTFGAEQIGEECRIVTHNIKTNFLYDMRKNIKDLTEVTEATYDLLTVYQIDQGLIEPNYKDEC